MTPKLAEYHRWMKTFSDHIQSIMAGRGAPQALGEALAARERAVAALENPTTLEERRMLVFTLIDYSNMFTGQIEGPEADARHRLNARMRAFDAAAELAADEPIRAEASVKLGMALLERLVAVVRQKAGESHRYYKIASENLARASAG